MSEDPDIKTVEYVGPFEQWQVVVDGWEVPLLTAHPQTGGKIFLSIDRRFGLELSLKDAELVVPFLAHAIAIAGGYACHPNQGSEPLLLRPIRPRRLTDLDALRDAMPDGET